jgi:hypothetical protein
MKVIHNRNSECQPVDTPVAPGTKLIKKISVSVSSTINDGKSNDSQFPYREAVGSLLWIARCCFPEILYAVNQVAVHCNYFDEVHITAVKRIMRYLLKGKKDQCLWYSVGAKDIEYIAYSDSDFMGEKEDCIHPGRSLSEFVGFICGTGFVNAHSTLQTTVSRSTAEAEYRAAGFACQKIMACRNQLEEMGFPQLLATTLLLDNQACIKMISNPTCGSSLRHIQNDHHYIRDCFSNKSIKPEFFCGSGSMIAMETKALPKDLLIHHSNSTHYPSKFADNAELLSK